MPPAGLYIEKLKHGLGQNPWEACGKQTRRSRGRGITEPKGPMFELPQQRDPEDAAKAEARAPDHAEWTGSAHVEAAGGLYVENSKAFGPHHHGRY